MSDRSFLGLFLGPIGENSLILMRSIEDRSSTESYLISYAQHEIDGVIRENEGKAAPHKLHLDPDEIRSSRHRRLTAVPGDESDESDEWDLQESEEEWEGPGDVMYRDYRRMQRSTFLIAHMEKRVQNVRQEMQR